MKVCPLMLVLAAFSGSPCCALAAETGPGAPIPWITYEAEKANTSGTRLGPDYTGRTPAREASGRSCVRLGTTGQYLEFTAKTEAQGIVVRYCIPDSEDGQGIHAALTLFINDQPREKLLLTSKYSYLYGAYPFTNKPSDALPRNFWDELRVMPGAIHAGDLIRLQQSADDTSSECLIDFVDLEVVPAPLTKPENALSVIDSGATPDDGSDDCPAFRKAVAAAMTEHKAVWIPRGRFVVKGAIDVNNVVIQGAGMWYTTLIGVDDYTPDNRVAIYGNGSNVTLADFAIVGKLTYRNDQEPNDGIGGSFGTGSSIRNIWVEHTKAGAWIINSDGLVVEGCRFRDTIADGINLCIGMRNSVVRNCTARGVGDDCFAMWPAVYAKSVYPHGSNRFVRCTAQLPFLAQGFSIYGGENNGVEDCEAVDIPYGAGLFASTTFPTEFGFRQTTSYRRSRVIRAGDNDGAIGTVANLVDLVGVRFQDIEVIDSPADGIKFTSIKSCALRDTAFDRIRIANTGLAGSGSAIHAAKGALGSAKISNVTVLDAKSSGWQNDATAFELVQGEGNSGVEQTK